MNDWNEGLKEDMKMVNGGIEYDGSRNAKNGLNTE